MIIYEVNITIPQLISDEFVLWLQDHIKQMLLLPGFVEAKLFHEIVSEKSEHEKKYVVHYFLNDQNSLEAYFLNHAQNMRAEGVKKFGDSLKVTRRTLGLDFNLVDD